MHLDIGLERSRRNRWIRGVCAGIARRAGVDAIWVRLAFLIAAAIIPGASLITVIVIYVVLGIMLPESETF